MHARVIFYVLLHTFFSCSSPTGGDVEILTPPIIIVVKSDSAIVVKDAEENNIHFTTAEKIDYRVHFLEVGDTLNNNYEKSLQRL